MKHSLSKKYFSGALLLTLFLYFVFSISGHLYSFTDNVTVSVVTSGFYGDNNMCQYIHPLFCIIIKILNPLLPTADVFAVLMHLFLLLGVFLISYAAIESSFQKPFKSWDIEDFILRALLFLAIVYFVLGLKLFGINYTVQTGAILAAGIFTLFYAMYTGRGRFWITGGTVLVSAGFLGRIEACLLFLPFLALELFAEFLRSERKGSWIKRAAGYVLPSIIAIAVLLGSKALYLRTEPYRSDAAYNHYRTITGDYPMETYGVTYKDWKGIDRDTYNAVLNWNLSDTDRIDTEMLKKIADVGSRNDYQLTKEGMKRTLLEMKRQSTKIDVHVMTLTALAIILTLWCVIAVKSIWLKLEALFSFLGGFIILFYFTFRGRAPLRVWQCVLIATLTVLVLVMIKDGTKSICSSASKERCEKESADGLTETLQTPFTGGHRTCRTAAVIFRLFLCVILYFGVGQVMAHAGIHKPVTPLTSRIGADDSVYEDTFESDTLYIWPWWHAAVPEYFSLQDKLPTKRVIEHNIGMGDWVYAQVYFRDFLDRIGASNPATALLERPNTYLVEGMEDDFLIYMKHYYGEDIEMEETGEIRGRKVFRFFRSGKSDNVYGEE